MDQEQAKFYEGEELENAQETLQTEPGEVNDMVAFLELLRHLKMMVERVSKIPMTNKGLIDIDALWTIVNAMDENLPDAIQYGMQMYSERERMLESAQKDAVNHITSAEMKANLVREKARAEAEQMIMDAEEEAKVIVAEAREYAQQMIDESEIMRRAREEAMMLRNDARVEANETRLRASHDASTLLTQVEDHLNQALSELRGMRDGIDKDEE